MDVQQEVGRPVPTEGAKRKEGAPHGLITTVQKRRRLQGREPKEEEGGREEGALNHQNVEPYTKEDIRHHFLPPVEPGSHPGATQKLAPQSLFENPALLSKAKTKLAEIAANLSRRPVVWGVKFNKVSGCTMVNTSTILRGHRAIESPQLAIEWDNTRLGILALEWDGGCCEEMHHLMLVPEVPW